ncbi:hypothetical protein, partial [uncultured Duncaniella sp.]|uniref:hypothetical protein n=1 Tax=uncultured Duncaniella sp. TaxID=2768039 RepID=UPI0025B0F740
ETGKGRYTLYFILNEKAVSPDSVHIRLNDTNEELVCHKDSVPWMSPLEVRQFITDLERRVAR